MSAATVPALCDACCSANHAACSGPCDCNCEVERLGLTPAGAAALAGREVAPPLAQVLSASCTTGIVMLRLHDAPEVLAGLSYGTPVVLKPVGVSDGSPGSLSAAARVSGWDTPFVCGVHMTDARRELLELVERACAAHGITWGEFMLRLSAATRPS